MKVTDDNKELIKLFMKLLMTFKVLDEDDVIGIVGVLPNEDSIYIMTEWLNDNANATATEIINKSWSIRQEFDEQGENNEQ